MVKTAKEQYRDELNRLAERLSAEQLREVKNYATFLAERGELPQEAPSKRHVTTEGWAGCLAHIDQDAVTLQHEAARQRAEREAGDAR